MKKLLTVVLLSLLLSNNANANSDYEYFSEVLQLEQRWQRVSGKIIDKYLVYLDNKGLLRGLSATDAKDLQQKIRADLEQRLAWNAVGEEVLATTMSACSPSTLREFAAAYENKSKATARSAARQYLECASKGIDESVNIIKRVFRDATPGFRALAKQYQR